MRLGVLRPQGRKSRLGRKKQIRMEHLSSGETVGGRADATIRICGRKSEGWGWQGKEK
jgi:hypothetical protein